MPEHDPHLATYHPPPPANLGLPRPPTSASAPAIPCRVGYLHFSPRLHPVCFMAPLHSVTSITVPHSVPLSPKLTSCITRPPPLFNFSGKCLLKSLTLL